MSTFFLYTAVLISLCYTAIAAFLYFNQRRILYVPDYTLALPEDYGLKEFKPLSLTTKDGVTLTAWYKPAKPNAKTVVYFHGNAGSLADRVEKLDTLTSRGMGMLAVSYRGYGTSKGRPSEPGLYLDGRSAIEYLTNTLKITANHIVIYGESLGSGIAIQMATEFPVHSIALEAPYLSILKLGQERYPFLPISILLKDHFLSEKKISKVHVPVIIFHGTDDLITPIAHGKSMLALANEPKQAHFYRNIGHTNFDLNSLNSHLHEFIEKY